MRPRLWRSWSLKWKEAFKEVVMQAEMEKVGLLVLCNQKILNTIHYVQEIIYRDTVPVFFDILMSEN